MCSAPVFLFQEILELLAAGRMPELAQRFRFDLPDALARDVELLSDLLQRARLAVIQAKAQAKHLFLARGERIEHLHQLLFEQRKSSHLRRRGRVVVRDKVAQVAVLLLADRRFK